MAVICRVMPLWTPERAVLEANLSFYEAFASRDFAAMDRLWSKRHVVAFILAIDVVV